MPAAGLRGHTQWALYSKKRVRLCAKGARQVPPCRSTGAHETRNSVPPGWCARNAQLTRWVRAKCAQLPGFESDVDHADGEVERHERVVEQLVLEAVRNKRRKQGAAAGRKRTYAPRGTAQKELEPRSSLLQTALEWGIVVWASGSYYLWKPCTSTHHLLLRPSPCSLCSCRCSAAALVYAATFLFSSFCSALARRSAYWQR